MGWSFSSVGSDLQMDTSYERSVQFSLFMSRATSSPGCGSVTSPWPGWRAWPGPDTGGRPLPLCPCWTYLPISTDIYRYLPISTDIYGNVSEYLDAGTRVWRNCGPVPALCLLYSSHLQQEQRNTMSLTSVGSPDRRL